MKNQEFEFQRNSERFQFLKWGSKAFDNFRIVPPGTGIVHQVLNMRERRGGGVCAWGGGLLSSVCRGDWVAAIADAVRLFLVS